MFINDATAKIFFFHRQAEKRPVLFGINLQKQTFCRNAINFFKYSIITVIFIILTNCTTIGFHNPSELNKIDFLGSTNYRICIIHEPGISEFRIQNLMNSLQGELKLYKLNLEWNIIGKVERPGFYTVDIFNYLNQVPLGENCDRMLLLLKRNLGDFLFHIFLPEIMGLVESNTRTRGFIYADYLTINILSGSTPSKVLIHENYHFLGCDHDLIMNECYKKIYILKNENQKNSNSKMFPTFIGNKIEPVNDPNLINFIIEKMNGKRQRN